MNDFLIIAFGGLFLIAVWAFVRPRHARGEFDRKKRVAELNRQAAKEGRLRSGSETR